jgi:hypothetical protein
MTIVKLATEQGLAFLVGVALVTIIQPETPGGTILLLAIGIAATNVLIMIGKLFFRGQGQATKGGPPVSADEE